MAKALLGYVGNGDAYRMASELRRLRMRVQELEAELEEVRAARLLDNTPLETAVSPELLTLDEPAPAYS